jgi:hypothetical protein
MQSVDTAFKGIKAAADAAEIRVDFRLSYPTEKVALPATRACELPMRINLTTVTCVNVAQTSLQLNEANAMSAISLSIASHCDQLRHLLQYVGRCTQSLSLSIRSPHVAR